MPARQLGSCPRSRCLGIGVCRILEKLPIPAKRGRAIFPYSSGFTAVKPLAFGLDGRFLSLVPSFPRRRLPSRLVNGATRRAFYTKQEALGGDGCPPIGVSDGDDLPRIFFFQHEPGNTHGPRISYRIYPASVRPGHGADSRRISSLGHTATMANRLGTGTRRVHTGAASTRLADCFPRGLQRAPRPPCGWPRLHTVASRHSSWCYGAQRLVGARHRDFRRRASHLSGHEDITRGPGPRCEADACSCPSPCLSSSLCSDTPQLVIRAKWAVQRKYPSRAMELCSSVCRPCRRWLWPLPS